MKILIVDDEPDTLTYLGDLLTAQGHSVVQAPNAVDGLCHVQMTRFDLILLDIMMPGMDGIQFAHAVTTHWKTFDIPIVVLSCRGDAETKAWAKLQGCSRYLEKPFSSAELLEVVNEFQR